MYTYYNAVGCAYGDLYLLLRYALSKLHLYLKQGPEPENRTAVRIILKQVVEPSPTCSYAFSCPGFGPCVCLANGLFLGLDLGLSETDPRPLKNPLRRTHRHRRLCALLAELPFSQPNCR